MRVSLRLGTIIIIFPLISGYQAEIEVSELALPELLHANSRGKWNKFKDVAQIFSITITMSLTQSSVVEGEADFNYPPAGKPWYKITGDLKTSKATPLIILHGGPGIGCSAYQPLTDLTIAYSIPIIQYDQVGCGRSTPLREKASASAEFWNDRIFVAELESLIARLGLKSYDIVGHCKLPYIYPITSFHSEILPKKLGALCSEPVLQLNSQKA